MNLLLALLVIFCCWETFSTDTSVNMNIINYTGAALELYWIDEIDRNNPISMLSEPLINGTSTQVKYIMEEYFVSFLLIFNLIKS
jgi:hypothetical protein